MGETDEIDEENKEEIEENEAGAKIQIIRPHAPIDGDKNGENYETDEIDEENKEEIEENEVGAKVQIIRPHVPIPNYSSYDDKMRLKSANKSTYVDNFKVETAKELEEINIKEKQKIKELEAEQNTIGDGKLVQEKKDKESINSKIVAEKNEFIDAISITENSLIDKIETEDENPERDKKTTKK